MSECAFDRSFAFSRYRVNDLERVIDVIRESLSLFAEALDATGDRFGMYGFSSCKRDPAPLRAAQAAAAAVCAADILKATPRVSCDRLRFYVVGEAWHPRPGARFNSGIRLTRVKERWAAYTHAALHGHPETIIIASAGGSGLGAFCAWLPAFLHSGGTLCADPDGALAAGLARADRFAVPL